MFFDIGQNIFECSRIFSVSVVKFNFYVLTGTFWGGSSTGKFLFFSFFYLGRNIFWVLTFSLWHDCQNCMVSARKNTVNKKISFLDWIVLVKLFSNFGRNVFEICWKKFGRFVEAAFHVFGKIFWPNSFFWKQYSLSFFLGFERTFFRLSPKFWERLPKLRFSCPEQFFWWKLCIFEKNCSSLFFWLRAKTFRSFEKNFRHGCLKCNIPVHRNN